MLRFAVVPLLLLNALAQDPPRPQPPRDDPPPRQPDRGRVDRARAADQIFAGLAARYDQDGDGAITAAEHGRGEKAFANLDHDGDGVITRADFDRRPTPPGGGRRGGDGGKRPQAPEVGQVAPDFELPMLGMKDTAVQLSSYRGSKPVALIFGSYT